jgi:hypothetical protein
MAEKFDYRSQGIAQAARRVVHFIKRRPSEAFLLVRMAGWVVLLSSLIKLLPLPRVLALIATPTRQVAPERVKVSQERLAQLVDLLLGIDLLCFTPTCWKRAPVLHRYLALNGIETRIVFGVRKAEGAGSLLDGHAWLESGGRPLLEISPPRYTVTYAFPS